MLLFYVLAPDKKIYFWFVQMESLIWTPGIDENVYGDTKIKNYKETYDTIIKKFELYENYSKF